MKAFRFPLQPVKTLREQKERNARLRYANALRQQETAINEVNAANEALELSWVGLKQELSSGATTGQVRRTRAWCNALEIRLGERLRAMQKARIGVSTAWQEMLQATRERESMDCFYDRGKAAYDREVQRQEQKTLDELAVQRALAQRPWRPHI